MKTIFRGTSAEAWKLAVWAFAPALSIAEAPADEAPEVFARAETPAPSCAPPPEQPASTSAAIIREGKVFIPKECRTDPKTFTR